LPATGEAVGAVRVELGGGSWWLPLSPRLPTVAMLQALAVVGGGRRIDAELLRRDLGLFGRLWSMDERADGAP
jgi:hypothetical protein